MPATAASEHGGDHHEGGDEREDGQDHAVHRRLERVPGATGRDRRHDQSEHHSRDRGVDAGRCDESKTPNEVHDSKQLLSIACYAWDARGVLEHVIGFHDVLLLRPLGLKPDRPRGDPRVRWQLTYDSLTEAFGSGGATQLDEYRLMPNLTRDVLVHTWDLARAVGADDGLDRRGVNYSAPGLPEDPQALAASGMFGAPVTIGDETDAQARLLARLAATRCRDPKLYRGGSWPLQISVCSSTYSCSPSGPNSRPMPDCLKPPNGAPMSERVHVDAVGAGADGGRDVEAVCDVGGPHRTGQPVVGVVGDADRVVLVAVAQHRQHRAENLLPGDAHVVGGVGEQRRLARTSRARTGSRSPPSDDAGAFAAARLDVVLDAALLALGDKRSDVGRLVGRVADLQRATSCRPARRRPRRVDASLTRMRVCATQAWPLFIRPADFRPATVLPMSASSRMIAADLPPSSRLTRLSCSPHRAAIRRPTALEPVNAILSTPGWRTSASPTSGPPGSTDTTPSGRPDLLDHLGQPQSVQRGFGRGLDDDRAAGDQRRDQLGHDQELRHVPRHDRPDHPDRGPAQMHFAEHTLAAFLPREVAGGGQREVDQRYGGGRLAHPAEAARRPHLVGDEIGHLVGVAGVDPGELFDLGHPVGVAHPRPRAMIERVPCGGDGGVDVLGARDLDMPDRLFGVRRDHGELLRIGGLAPWPPMNSSS